MDSIARLRHRWEKLTDQLKALGPMRSGSICPLTVRSTDKHGAPKAHGPYLVHTYKRRGKTITRRLRDAHQVETCRRQIANFRRFQELTCQLAQISQRLADLEAAGDSGSKKNSRR